jgi:hypothetical protein
MNEPLSTCCGAPPIGETHFVKGKPTGDVVGICNDCRDHAIFEDASPDDDDDNERLLTMADGWQPIATAPRDGEPFLAFEPHDLGGFKFVATYTKAERLVDTLEGNAFPYVTHWMPLPENP